MKGLEGYFSHRCPTDPCRRLQSFPFNALQIFTAGLSIARRERALGLLPLLACKLYRRPILQGCRQEHLRAPRERENERERWGRVEWDGERGGRPPLLYTFDCPLPLPPLSSLLPSSSSRCLHDSSPSRCPFLFSPTPVDWTPPFFSAV